MNHTYKCPNGHIFQKDFGEEVQIKCPHDGCDATVQKFRHLHDEPAPSVAATDNQNAPNNGIYAAFMALDPKMRVKYLVGAAIVLVGVFILLLMPKQAPKPAEGAVIPVLDAGANKNINSGDSSKADVVSTAMRNQINEISISNFQATPSQISPISIKINFTLTNSGTQNDYPKLVIAWRGVAVAPIEVTRDGYPHTSAPFTTLPVEFEIAKPQGATGVDVSVKY